MTPEQAQALAQFIKDHDKRFEAKAKTEDGDSHVLLTRADDGTELPPLRETEQYQAEYLDAEDPGPTVRAAWEKWRPAE